MTPLHSPSHHPSQQRHKDCPSEGCKQRAADRLQQTWAHWPPRSPNQQQDPQRELEQQGERARKQQVQDKRGRQVPWWASAAGEVQRALGWGARGDGALVADS